MTHFNSPILIGLFAAATLVAGADASSRRTEMVSEGSASIATLGTTDPKPALQLTVAGKNEVRYRVRERLMGKDLDNDAVGATGNVTGSIAFDKKGNVLLPLSKFVVRVESLTTDQPRRDGYVRRRLLETDQNPEVVFVPKTIAGLPNQVRKWKDGTEQSFQVLGDLTIKGVTKPVTWTVKARRDGQAFTGSAGTAFTFVDFNLTQPRVPIVLSVADTIRLEYDFTLAPANSPSAGK